MNILITGARAPISADLAKVLASAGHTVHTTDSLAFPVGRFSPYVTRYFQLPAPRPDFQRFREGVLRILERHKIDWIIPTSEEVFWLAQIAELGDRLFAPRFAALAQLHDKARFAELVSSLGYGAARNVRLSSSQDAKALLSAEPSDYWVVKPVYSRFGTDVLFSPSPGEILKLDFRRPWLAQTRVSGKEVCVYAVASSGNVCFATAYQPRYRVGRGASIYFEPIEDTRILPFAQAVAGALCLTGQISFDVMLTENGLIALECNPRGTSGIHLAAQRPALFAAALTGQCQSFVKPDLSLVPAVLGVPFFMYHGLNYFSTKAVRADFRRSHEAMKSANLPFWAALLATAELLVMAALYRRSPIAQSTRDIEWNGE